MKNIFIPGFLLILAGCASIVNGTNQSLSVKTASRGVAVTGAYCKLTNDKGSWFVTTPGSTTVHRSVEDLLVNCKKKGYEPGLTNIKSSTKGIAFGNILFGGIVGGAVDVGDGAAFDYPPLINVQMEKNIAAMRKPSQGKTTKESVNVAHTGKNMGTLSPQ